MQFLTINDLRNLSREQRAGYALAALTLAVEKMLTEDTDLLAIGAHEQAVCHRIAVYLEPMFRGLNIDCEYNRSRSGPKRILMDGNPTLIRPDILVHQRIEKEFNILAVEAKANANPENDRDAKKVMGLVVQEQFSYSLGVFLVIHDGKSELLEDVTPRATIYRYDGTKWNDLLEVRSPVRLSGSQLCHVNERDR